MKHSNSKQRTLIQDNYFDSAKSSKRSNTINLTKMRKAFTAKPLALGVSSIMLAACSDDRQEAMIFTSLDECKNQYPEYSASCDAAYQQAIAEASRTSPKFQSQRDCETDFGDNQCVAYRSDNGQSWFMPFMAGYMVSGLFSNRHYSSPLFTSHSYGSPYRYRWIGADGYDYGDYRMRKKKVSPKAFTPKPTVSRTISRGGFGSSVRAKSSWGSSKGGWGG